MRKYFLITAMLLASATAQAGPVRSLTLASNEPPATVEAPKAAQTPTATEAPAYVARPSAVGTTTEAPKAAETTKPVVEKTTKSSRAEKPKRKRESVEARVIRELNRHGIYW
jgi:hypothetical protein